MPTWLSELYQSLEETKNLPHRAFSASAAALAFGAPGDSAHRKAMDLHQRAAKNFLRKGNKVDSAKHFKHASVHKALIKGVSPGTNLRIKGSFGD